MQQSVADESLLFGTAERRADLYTNDMDISDNVNNSSGSGSSSLVERVVVAGGTDDRQTWLRSAEVWDGSSGNGAFSNPTHLYCTRVWSQPFGLLFVVGKLSYRWHVVRPPRNVDPTRPLRCLRALRLDAPR